MLNFNKCRDVCVKSVQALSDKWRLWYQDLTIQYICFALLSTMLVHPVCANNFTTDISTIRVSELEFSEQLSNPCALVNTTHLQRDTLTQENKNATRQSVINEMKVKASLLMENAEIFLRTNVLRECSTLELPSVARIPSAENIADSTPLNVLRLFYTSLLNHTAHVYFISEQMQRYSTDDNCNNLDLSENATSLASDMRELLCVSRICMLMIQKDNDENDTLDDSTEQILNEQFTDQPVCSRRSVRDCQTIGSTVALLRKLANYLQNAVLIVESDSTSSILPFYTYTTADCLDTQQYAQ